MTEDVARTPRRILYGLLIFAPLARGGDPDWAVTTMMLTVLAAAAVFLTGRCLNWDWQWIQTPLDKPLALLLLLAGVSAVFSIHPPASWRALGLLAAYLAVFYLTIHSIRTRAAFRRLIYLCAGLGAGMALFGLFKRFGLNPFPWWSYEDLRYPPEFLSATFGNHNHMSGFLEMALPITLGLLMTRMARTRRWMLVYAVFLMLVAWALTLSRGGWVSMLGALAFMAAVLMKNRYFAGKKALAAGIVAAVVLGGLVLVSTPVVERAMTMFEMDEAASFASRWLAWSGTVSMIKEYPLLGAGPGTFAFASTPFQPPGLSAHFTRAHNDYLQAVAETGFLIVPIGLWLAIALFARGRAKLNNPSGLVRGATLGAMAGIVAILIHSVVDFNLHIPANALLFTVLAAVVAAPVPVDNLKGRFRSEERR